MLMMPFVLELPPELVLHVLTRLPLKYLMRLRCVSKFFLALTNNPNFISFYRKSNPNPDFNFMDTTTTTTLVCASTKERQWQWQCQWRFHILFKGSNFIYLQKRHQLIPFRCPKTNKRLIGSINGLICFGETDPQTNSLKIRDHTFDELYNIYDSKKDSLEIYNIFAGTNYYIIPPRFDPPTWDPVFVFGYDPISNDYKILRIETFFFWQIYSFRTNSWKNMTNLNNWDYDTVLDYSEGGHSVCINGVIYWPPGNKPPQDLCYPYSDKIVFFHLHKEKFGLIQIPKEKTQYPGDIQLLSFRGSLAFAFIDNRTSSSTTSTTRKRMRSGATTSHGGGGEEIWVELFILCKRKKKKLWNRLSFALPISPPPKEVEIVLCGNEIFLGWFESDNQLLRLYNLYTKCIFDLPLSPPSHYYPKASFMEKEEDNPTTYVDNLSFDFSLI